MNNNNAKIKVLGIGKFIEQLEIKLITLYEQIIKKILFSKKVVAFLFFSFINKIKSASFANKSAFIIIVLFIAMKLLELRKKKYDKIIKEDMFFTKEEVKKSHITVKDNLDPFIIKIKEMLNKTNKIREVHAKEKESLNDRFFKIAIMLKNNANYK
jgi:hypothetical protein